MENVEPVRLTADNCREDALDRFVRTQKVVRSWRMTNGQYCLAEQPFTDDWSPERKRQKARELTGNALAAFGIFIGGGLAGFIGLVTKLNGDKMIVDTLHVSAPFRGLGLGRKLFMRGIAEAKRRGAKALYISACSSEETIAFYRAMGAELADHPIPELAEEEPFDLQLIRRI